jgi:DNA (cytosine-5)-methyltransferase 1
VSGVIRYASVCSGVEAASLAWGPLGWKPVFFSEIEKFPCEVLKQRWTHVPNLGDMTKINGKEYNGAVDLLVGGTPCQSFSIAGKRAGLEGQSGLALHYIRILGEIKPEWFIWENVPGVLSCSGGEDFKAILEAFVEVGYHVAWRVLDTQYVRVDGFGRAIPQRRRRVFVVGNLRDWRHAAGVLFDSESFSRNPPPRREAREGTASDVAHCLRAQAQLSHRADQDNLICMAHGQGNAKIDSDKAPTLTSNHEAPIICFHGSQDPISNNDTANCIGRNQGLENCICYENHAQDSRIKNCGNVSPQLNAKAGTGGGNLPLVQCNLTVRRLTPLECERLMGFPDNHTRIQWKGKPDEQCPDGHRYKACGNSMSVNCMRWLGRRIEMINKINERD